MTANSDEYTRMMMAMTTTTMEMMMTIMMIMTMMTLCFLLLQGLPGEGSLKNEEGDAPAVCHPQIRMTSFVIFSSKKASSFDADRHPTLLSNRTSSSNTSLLHHLQIVSF